MNDPASAGAAAKSVTSSAAANPAGTTVLSDNKKSSDTPTRPMSNRRIYEAGAAALDGWRACADTANAQVRSPLDREGRPRANRRQQKNARKRAGEPGTASARARCPFVSREHVAGPCLADGHVRPAANLDNRSQSVSRHWLRLSKTSATFARGKFLLTFEGRS